MTGTDIVARARVALVDTASPYRWSDDELLDALNEGIQELFTRRPDCVVLEDDMTVRADRPASLGELADPLPVHPRFMPALLHYIIGRAYETDSDEVVAGAGGRADIFIQRFYRDAEAL